MKSYNKTLNQDMLDLGKSRYFEASGFADMERDDDGFIILKRTASKADSDLRALNTNIDSLEEKLRKYKEAKKETIKYQKTDDYKESKKDENKKKQKKKRESLLSMVFNNADALAAEENEEDEEDESYRDSKKAKAKKAKEEKLDKTTTLNTTYGKRFSPIVSLIYDNISDFDAIAEDIKKDLDNSRNTARTMYRAQQISNLLSAKNSKLSAISKLTDVAKTISDYEYKREKDKRESEGTDTNRIVASTAAKFLRGNLEDFGDSGKKSSKKKDSKKDKDKDKDKKKVVNSGFRSLSRSDLDDDDDDEPFGTVSKSGSKRSEAEQREMASEFANALLKHKDEIKFTPHERYSKLEGTYQVMVIVDPQDLDRWKYVAVGTKGKNAGKILDDDEYEELLPKKKKARMTFDLSKGRCTDRNSNRTYKLMYR